MKILKEFECDIDIAGEEVKCIVYVNAYYTTGPKYGLTETSLDDIEIDEILSIETEPVGLIELKDVTNLARLTDYLYDKVLNDVVDPYDTDSDYSNDLNFFDDLNGDWN
jgi:hypothetical protein